MDYYAKLSGSIVRYVLFSTIGLIAFLGAAVWAFHVYLYLPYIICIAVAVFLFVVGLYAIARSAAKKFLAPMRMLSQAILHVTPGQHGLQPPDLNKLRVGRELVTNLAMQVYQIASQTQSRPETPAATNTAEARSQAILDGLPAPLLVLDKNQDILYANQQTANFLGLNQQALIGQNISSVLNLSFSSEDTLDSWLGLTSANSVTASKTWEHVKIQLPDQESSKQIDLSAYYNKDNPAGVEAVILLHDKTTAYQSEDDSLGFIALAVHELRTPLTMLRGYIEVFEDELAGKLDQELDGFLQKMQASAQQLSSFVSNILNVARVEENQLFLELQEAKWGDTLKASAADMELRAKLNEKQIIYKIADNLPTVGVDKVSIYEVINNLLDNAIKYSKKDGRIIVSSQLNDEGMVETTIQDFGIGIPTSIIDKLFQKFYRNHRSRAQVGGTGLGLYLSKAIITAHGGQIWVRSKEGEGSVFGFTLQPYSQVAKAKTTNDNSGIVRTAHGWIKNHSFYRR